MCISRYWWVLIWLLPLGLHAQILDDTTVVKYGPSTSRYRFERDIFYQSDTLYTVDTVFNDIHHQDNFTNNKWAQPLYDLGNVGTANRPLFYQPVSGIGNRLGLDSYHAFAPDPSSVRYFNTFSPYSYMNYTNGFGGREKIEAGINRNINNRLNLGLAYRRFVSNKYQGVARAEDYEGDHHSGQINGSYFSKNGRYVILFNAYSSYHKVWHTGGALGNSSLNLWAGGNKTDSLFNYQIQRVRLSSNAYSLDRRQGAYVYQEYQLLAPFRWQLYHRYHYNEQEHNWGDGTLANSLMYGDTLNRPGGNGTYLFPSRRTFDFRSNQVYDATRYFLHENELGAKSRIGGFFIAGYVKRRDLVYRTDTAGDARVELLAGGQIKGNFWNDRIAFFGQIEASQLGDLSLTANAKLSLLEAGITVLRQSPSLYHQRYESTFFKWRNDFAASASQGIYLQLREQITKSLHTTLRVEQWLLSNYIYMNELARPQQAGDVVSVRTASLDIGLAIGRYFGLKGFGQWAQVSGPDVLRLPPWYAAGQFFYQKSMYSNALALTLGIEVRARGSFLGDRFMPVHHQFFLQQPNGNPDNFMLPSFVVIEPFANLRFRRFNLWFKGLNTSQAALNQGYWSAPFYPAQPFHLVLGINWQFFD